MACHCFKLEVMATVNGQDILNSSSEPCLWVSGDIGDVTRHVHLLISAHCQEPKGMSVN